MALQQIIPSYLYTAFKDDDDLQAFVNAFNALAQQYLNTFNGLQLPVFPNQSGSLLDWVCNGIYGFARPTVPIGVVQTIGPLNTVVIGTHLPINGLSITGTSTYYTATDDVYIRALCWNFYKADGTAFNVQWFKRRIARFLYGPGEPATTNGFAGWGFNIGFLQNISVSFPSAGVCNVSVPAINSLSTTFKALVLSGALQTPFQFSFDITFV